MDLHLHFHLGGDDPAAVKTALATLTEKVDAMSGSIQDKIDALRSKVEHIDQVGDSAVALIQGFPQMIRDAVAAAQSAGATPEQLAAFDELGAKIDAEADSLAAAVAAGTPASGGGTPGGPTDGGAPTA